MANYKGHIVGGVLVNTAFISAVYLAPGNSLSQTSGLLTNWQFVAGLYIIAILFSLWPDVDTNSKGQNIFYGLAFIINILLIATGKIEASAYLGLLAMTPIIGKHRGWTHSKIAMVLIPAPILVVSYLYRGEILTSTMLLYGASVAGYFSHLLFDGLILKRFRVKGSRYD